MQELNSKISERGDIYFKRSVGRVLQLTGIGREEKSDTSMKASLRNQ